MGSGNSSPIPTVQSKHYDPVMAKIPDSAFAGRSIAITGCSTGIGREVALAAAERGVAQIFMLNRQSERATAAEQAVRAKASAQTKVMTIECDLKSFASVRAAAAKLVAETKSGGLDILLLNAAVMACNEEATADGYDVQSQVNVLSHFLLTRECMPALNLAAEARVVSQSSSARIGKLIDAKYLQKLGAPGSLGGNTRGIMSNGAVWERYHQAKLGNVVFTMALHDRLKAANSKVKALVCEPGLAATELQKTSMANDGMTALEGRLIYYLYQSAQDGALPALTACFAPDAQSGDFYVPKGGFSGPPIAAATAGAFANAKRERMCADVPSRDVLWKASEEALGAFVIAK